MNLIDEGTRKALAIEVTPSLSSVRVIALLEELAAYVFDLLAEVRALMASSLMRFNTRRPCDSFRRVPPLTYLPCHAAADSSALQLSA